MAPTIFAGGSAMSIRARVLGSIGIVTTACSAGGGDAPPSSPGAAGSPSSDAALDTSSVLDSAAVDTALPPVAHLLGHVYAPEGTIPISGALVYATAKAPSAIPQERFCDKCVKLPAEVPYTSTAPDGSFDLGVGFTGTRYLVVQKGQFRRVRSIDVVEGTQQVPKELTTLPGKTDLANGDDIPKMAIILGQWDAIEVSIAKLGLGTVQKVPLSPTPTATGSFDLYGTTKIMGKPNPPASKLLKAPAVMNGYHIIFIPCSGSDGTTCNWYDSGDKQIQANLKDWVAKGGKLYVTDYSYDFVRQPFPGYVDWEDQTSEIGSACQAHEYNVPATVQDQGLKDWLAAMGVTSFEVQKNWTTVSAIHAVDWKDMDGNPVKVTPKVWVDAQKGDGPHPATLSFERECGRVLFSTYHTEADQSSTTTLLPQEKALLYVLLEVSVCVAPPSLR
jgi:hypothetical protein